MRGVNEVASGYIERTSVTMCKLATLTKAILKSKYSSLPATLSDATALAAVPLEALLLHCCFYSTMGTSTASCTSTSRRIRMATNDTCTHDTFTASYPPTPLGVWALRESAHLVKTHMDPLPSTSPFRLERSSGWSAVGLLLATCWPAS